VDEGFLAEFTKWVAGGGDGTGRRQKPPEAAPKALNFYALYMALALAADPQPDTKVRETLTGLRKNVMADQIEDGSWVAWTETRPPLFTTSNTAATALALLALRPTDAGPDKAIRDKAHKWLQTPPADKDAQDLALRLVIAHRFNQPDESTKPLLKQLRAQQNPDGGWSQAKDMTSDAYATGQALFALAEAGVKLADPAVKRGHAFLAKTQQPDGGWPMTSRPCPPSNKGSKSLIPITGAGAAWATLGLVRTTPNLTKSHRP
jgi:hypothetical protein